MLGGEQVVNPDLHSTMYLLNPGTVFDINNQTTFTFHYVSIKSNPAISVSAPDFYLHSTMYLLNLLTRTQAKIQQPDLHSTMYLLNQFVSDKLESILSKFTFHYVSIKSYKVAKRRKRSSIYIPLCIY